MKLKYVPEVPEMFIALGLSYQETKVIQLVEDKNDKSQLYGAYFDDLVIGTPRHIVKKPLTEFPGPYFPIFSRYREPRKELQPHYQLYKKIVRLVELFLITQPKYTANIKSVERHLSGKFTIEEVQTILKVLFAETIHFKLSVTGTDEYIAFNEFKAQHQNHLLYLGTIAEELKIKSAKISLLVSHGQTVGNYREVILRDLIKQHLPAKFAVATGFVQGFARQLDIIIYDCQNYAPAFKEGDLVVVKQEAVRAIIEVKTTLTSRTLFEALEMFHHISLPGFRTTALPIFKGIFSFDSSYTQTASIAKYIFDFYNKPYLNQQVQYNMTRKISYLFHEITCVTTLNKHCVLSKYVYAKPDKTGHIIPTLFSATDINGIDIQTATFMSLLFDYLDVESYAKKASVWNFSGIVGPSSSFKTERKLVPDDWFPQFRKQNEHDGSQESIKKRLALIDHWFQGKVGTATLLNPKLTNADPEQI
ncbi:MAG TPA: DUF6602 domain-containing protein [Mucilaginibacter sp.]|jgi:hypothetical protein